ncbi:MULTISPECIES: AAA family ATPase [Enterobacterales]|jgi:AAA15 family ATPase/GTPase|nr:ATP-binding protein [Hafnia alvei]KAA0259812.1 ATP-binding protein [Hafnia alvei]MEA1625067.1 ATP-binding protein [Salmonella enterica]HDL7347818.1 ATP-binding protein [Yersinia enterocolitica]
MFVYIAIENFRSIKEKMIFNLSASGSNNHLSGHFFKNDLMPVGTLRSAGVYGANASGKSNVLMAFEAIKFIATESGDLKEGKRIPCHDPYALSASNVISPVHFEAEFYSAEGNRFVYEVKFTKDQIVFESLDYYPSRVKANLFTRYEDDSWESIKFGGHYKGGIKKIPFFKNNSYLSKAGDNAATPDIIKEAYNFFRKQIRHIGLKEKIRISSFGDREDVVNDTAKVLCMVDTGISGIAVKEMDSELPIKMDDDIPQEIKEIIEEDYKYRYMFSHATEEGGSVSFSINRESEGTQKLFEIIPLIKSAFDEKKVVIFDELDNSLHPHIADLIVRLFNDPDVNKKGSQLVFSTHNMQLMTPEKMRRDQIWFCEKRSGASFVYSLDDFDKKKVKTTTPYANWYDEGRFGGVPDINYLKIASFLSDYEPTVMSDVDVNNISEGFFEEFDGDFGNE